MPVRILAVDYDAEWQVSGRKYPIEARGYVRIRVFYFNVKYLPLVLCCFFHIFFPKV